MKFALILALIAPLAACRAPSGGIDYGATADAIALYRQDVMDVAFLAEPETQVRLQELGAAIERVESALRMADSGGASSAAEQALALADLIALELAPESELRFYIALAKIAMRHVQAGQPTEVVLPDEIDTSPIPEQR